MFPKTIITKRNDSILLREPQYEDASQMIEHIQTVAGESDFLSFGIGENNKTIAQIKQWIDVHQNTPNQIMLLAFDGEKVVGMMNLMARNDRPRLVHIGEFGISVIRQYWGVGIGRAMLENLLEWAKSTQILTKINLKVDTSNTKAAQLYEKLGFEYEGILRRDMRINGVYKDSYCMGLLL